MEHIEFLLFRFPLARQGERVLGVY
jgi:hypothetical protein